MDALSTKTKIESLRTAQRDWSSVRIADRAAAVRRLASLVASHARELHASIRSPQRCDYRETIAAEVLPLADAARWLSKNAVSVLRSRRAGMYQRPIWLGRVRSEVSREPLGIVFIIGTWNYPVLLTGVQMMQALVAGNAVVVKPAPGCEETTAWLARLLIEAGVPSSLIEVVDASIETANQVIDARVDRVIMTGSSQSGRLVLKRLAEHLTPAVMELSGCDAIFVLDDAKIERVVAALLFGLRLNGGATCVAPRRVYVPSSLMESFVKQLSDRLHEIPATTLSPASADRIVRESQLGNARLVLPTSGASESMETWIRSGKPVVLRDLSPESPLAKADIFAPITMLFAVDSIASALVMDRRCLYGLTASIFGGEAEATSLASKLNVGSVSINDLIVPTADPRLPFGGVQESGYGVTRGVEGLLELTRPKVTSVRRGRWLLHLDAPQAKDEQILEGLLQWLHAGSWRKKWSGLCGMVRAAMSSNRKPQK